MNVSGHADSPVIFVVDDDEGMRSALHRLFKSAAFAVETFVSAQDLLARGDLDKADVLVLDVMMPGMTGLELQALLIERQVDTPIVFLTGAQSVPMAVTAMRRGAVDFLEKPFENDDLVKRVRQALRPVHAKNGRALHVEYDRRTKLLTPREREVMDYVVAGQTSKEIGRALNVSPRTIEIHRTRIMDKMQAGSLAELVSMVLTLARSAIAHER
jgi:two-component system response regulator FixJ